MHRRKGRELELKEEEDDYAFEFILRLDLNFRGLHFTSRNIPHLSQEPVPMISFVFFAPYVLFSVSFLSYPILSHPI